MTDKNQHAQHMGHQDRNKEGQKASGNFKNDPERAREAGRKGGEHSHGGHRNEKEEE